MNHKQEVINMKLDDLVPDKLNPRQEFVIEDMVRLEKSISQRGILNPLLVENTEAGYLILDGERRYRVAKRLGMSEVPVRITAESLTDKDRLLVRFNLQEVHSPWTAWDKSVAVAELVEMTGWNVAEISRQLGVSSSSVSTLLALQKLAKRTISVMQEAKIPVESVARVASVTRRMTPEKATAVEEAFVAGVEDGKIYNAKTANKFLTSTKKASTAQLRKYASQKKYESQDILKENNDEHATAERVCRANFGSARSMAVNLSKFLSDNPSLLVQERTRDNAAGLVVALERLLRIIGKRVEAPIKEVEEVREA